MNRTRLTVLLRRLLIVSFVIALVGVVLMYAVGIRPVHLKYVFSEPMELTAQEEAEVHSWLKSNAIHLKTLDAGSGFEDMGPLKDVIGDAGIVSLGEQTHVNREFHRANCRMIEFLVSEMGFTVFGIEANFAGGMAINDYIVDGKGTAERALGALLYSAWYTGPILEMVEWMREYNSTHEKKVRFYGFDNKPGYMSAQAVSNYIKKIDGPKDYDEILSVLMNPWTARYFSQGPKDKIPPVMEKLKKLISYLESQKPAGKMPQRKEWSLAVQHARLVLQHLEFWHTKPSLSEASDMRDRQMAENARWIRDYEDGAKMILWAASPHAGAMRGTGNMGDHLRRMYGDDMVVIGLIRNRRVGSDEIDLVAAAQDHPVSVDLGTLVGTLTKAGLKMSVVDFQSLPKGTVSKYFNSPFVKGGVKTLYPEAFDAVLFIELTSTAKIPWPDNPSNTSTLSTPSNLGFEEASNGIPKDWTLRGKRSLLQYETTLSGDDPYEGNASCVIRKVEGYCFGEDYGAFHQEIEAGNYKGKKIKLTAASRVGDGIGHLWLSIEVRKGEDLFLQEEITSDKWQEYHIVADVPEGAKKITYGFAYFGKTAAYIDDVSLGQ